MSPYLRKNWVSLSFVFLMLLFHPSLEALNIDLKEPIYSEGVLSTEQGGVITGPSLRVQARKIRYTVQDAAGAEVSLLEAEGDIILELRDYIFVGRRLVYNFKNNTGTLYDGKTSIEPWFIGGEEILLCADGSYVVLRGFATTSENYQMDWRLETERAHLRDYRFLSARDVRFRFLSLPIFWVPSLHLNLDTLCDSPFRYTFRMGGRRGARVGLSYKLYSTDSWDTRLNLDYRFKSGFGGGFETNYKSPDRNGYFHSVNYISEDRPRYDPKERTRYRLQGIYHHTFDRGRTQIDLTYDKLSDKEMATDYDDRDLRLETATPTQFEIRRQECNWILDLLTRVRVNGFQTVKQELPTLSGSYRPFEIGKTGILGEGRFKTSYLELEYTDHQPENEPQASDYNSPRYELYQLFWRPWQVGWLKMTPEAGGLAIYYGNNSHDFDKWMTIALFGLEAHTDLYRHYGSCKHILTPYIYYQYYIHPSTSPDDHFIFDIDDGWYRLNALRFGFQNNLYIKRKSGCLYRKLYADLFAYAFFDTDTLPHAIPKAYLKLVYNFSPRLRWTAHLGWDFLHNTFDHDNILLEWTINNDAAFTAEYRHRSAFDWRKADRFNFILDSFRSIEELEDTILSDRRDTFLLNLFYRFHPNWALTLQSRSGWNRKDEDDYNEYQIAFLGTFRSAWQIKLSYKHREDDDRVSINFGVGFKRPPCQVGESCIPCLEF